MHINIMNPCNHRGLIGITWAVAVLYLLPWRHQTDHGTRPGTRKGSSPPSMSLALSFSDVNFTVIIHVHVNYNLQYGEVLGNDPFSVLK